MGVGSDDAVRPNAELLDSIEFVATRLESIDCAEARSLAERAARLRAVVLAWDRSPPTASERDDVAKKILGLHVGLSQLRRETQ